VSEKNGNSIEANDTVARTGIEIRVPSRKVPEEKNTSDVMPIDYNNQHTSAYRQVPARQATGPRTELGKQRSSRNAVKHGIFSGNCPRSS
jgi:hypothetical protein